MKLTLKRTTRTDLSTIGELYIDGKFFCYTLEDKDRGLKQTDSLLSITARKLFGVTAIPAGTYKVQLTYSNRFKKIMPLIMDVKGFAGIRIHVGNYHTDTEGCILVGMQQGFDKIINSKDAYDALMGMLHGVPDITIEIV